MNTRQIASREENIVESMQDLIRSCCSGGKSFFLDTTDFPWVAKLEAEWPVIRKEMDRALCNWQDIPNFQDIQVEQRLLTDDDRWKTLFFYAYGHRSDRNCAEYPETCRLVEMIPGMSTAMFSILDGPKYIPPHRGPYNGVLRYHLGLKVPPGCGIQVGDETRSLAEGGSLIFDDTYLHSAWNISGDVRVILFVDFIRPLNQMLDKVNRFVIGQIGASPFITDALYNLNRWHESHEA